MIAALARKELPLNFLDRPDILESIQRHLPRMLALSTDQLVDQLGLHAARGYVTALDVHKRGVAFLREAGETLCQPHTEPVVTSVLRAGGYHKVVQVLDAVLGATTPLLALVGLGIILKRLGVDALCRTYGVPIRFAPLPGSVPVAATTALSRQTCRPVPLPIEEPHRCAPREVAP